MASQVNKGCRKHRLIPLLNNSPNIREEDLFFRILMFFHLPAAWPVWLVGASLIGWAGLVLILYHSPELMPLASRHDIDLYLCGHTHGGQVRFPGFGALFTSSTTGKRYEMGRYDENGTTLYVSRGIGLEGHSMPRLRLFCPPEVTLVTISGKA